MSSGKLGNTGSHQTPPSLASNCDSYRETEVRHVYKTPVAIKSKHKETKKLKFDNSSVS